MYKLKSEHPISVHYPIKHPLSELALDKKQLRTDFAMTGTAVPEFYSPERLTYLHHITFILQTWRKPHAIRAHLFTVSTGWEGDSYAPLV